MSLHPEAFDPGIYTDFEEDQTPQQDGGATDETELQQARENIIYAEDREFGNWMR